MNHKCLHEHFFFILFRTGFLYRTLKITFMYKFQTIDFHTRDKNIMLIKSLTKNYF